jgi:hypothetical protein
VKHNVGTCIGLDEFMVQCFGFFFCFSCLFVCLFVVFNLFVCFCLFVCFVAWLGVFFVLEFEHCHAYLKSLHWYLNIFMWKNFLKYFFFTTAWVKTYLQTFIEAQFEKIFCILIEFSPHYETSVVVGLAALTDSEEFNLSTPAATRKLCFKVISGRP